MIGLWLRSLFTPCPWHLRRLGFLREQLAIGARYRRNRQSWDPHLRQSCAAVLAAANSCPTHQRALILGAGLLHDVPLAELAAQFQELILADILHLRRNRRQAASVSPKITCVSFDCTAAVTSLWRAGNAIDDQVAIDLFRHASPSLPAELTGAPDLTVSLNLASQLGYLPADWLIHGRSRPQGFSLSLRRAAALRHIEWLQGLPGIRLLVADRALVVRELDGSEAEREAILSDSDLPLPDYAWVWQLAPAPEWDKEHHLELEVGAWVL